MKIKSACEKEILRDFHDLPQQVQEKFVKILRLLKQDIIMPQSDEKKATAEFLKVCGAWEDERSTSKQIRDIHFYRKSTMRTEKIF